MKPNFTEACGLCFGKVTVSEKNSVRDVVASSQFSTE